MDLIRNGACIEMNDKDIYRLEQKIADTDVKTIESVRCPDLIFFVSASDKERVAIAGQSGITILTQAMVTALVKELPEVVEAYV